MKDLNIYVHTLNQSETNLSKQIYNECNDKYNTALHTIGKLPKT